MARCIAVGILVGVFGLFLTEARIYSLAQSTSQGTSSPTLDSQQVKTQSFLQNIQQLQRLGEWGPPANGLRMSILEDDEDDAEVSNNPAWQEFATQSNECEVSGRSYCGGRAKLLPPPVPSQKHHLLLEIRNDGDLDVTILTGHACATIRSSGVTSLVVINLTDSRGRSVPVRFVGIGPPYMPGCSGAVRAFASTIGAGKPFAAILDLGRYMNLSGDKSYHEMAYFPAGTYGIQAQLELRSSPLGSVPAFGTLTSNTVQVQFGEFSRPLY